MKKVNWIKVLIEAARYFLAILAGAVGGSNSEPIAQVFNDLCNLVC